MCVVGSVASFGKSSLGDKPVHVVAEDGYERGAVVARTVWLEDSVQRM